MKKAKPVKRLKKSVKKVTKSSKPAKKPLTPLKKNSKPVKAKKPIVSKQKSKTSSVKTVKKIAKKAKPLKILKKTINKVAKKIVEIKNKVKNKKAIPSVDTNKLNSQKQIISVNHKFASVNTKMKDTPKGKTTAAPEKSRYSDNDLKEFKGIILNKLEEARKELINLQAALVNANEHGTDDTASTFKMLEDGSDTLAKEEAGQLAVRQRKFIEQLENALVRIENKTYGICRVTGKLIPKERLRAVPHTTQSIEAKLQQYKD